MENKLANPAPLGLMGFGMTTVLLNIHNAGFFPVSAMILAMGIFYGGRLSSDLVIRCRSASCHYLEYFCLLRISCPINNIVQMSQISITR